MLVKQSTSARILLFSASVVAYVALFFTVHGIGEGSVVALSIAPVMLLGAMFGQRAGVIGALGVGLLNLALLHIHTQTSSFANVVDSGWWSGMVSLLLVGLLIGQHHDARVKLRRELGERQHMIDALRSRDRQLQLMQMAVDHASNGVVITDAQQPDHPVVYANPGFERMTGYAASEIVGQNCRLLLRDDRGQPALAEMRAALKDQRPCQVLLRNYRKDGSSFWNELSIRPIRDQAGGVVYYVGVQHDVTANLENQARLEYLSSHDSLTGLYNRSFFHSAIEQMNASAQLPVSIMVADMDGLKGINDSAGHAVGDDRLRQAGELLRHVFREQDVVARLGGDEFAVLMPNTNLYQSRRLLDTFREYLSQHNQEKPSQAIEFSCGLALLSDGDNVEHVLHLADMAMYSDKARRKKNLN